MRSPPSLPQHDNRWVVAEAAGGQQDTTGSHATPIAAAGKEFWMMTANNAGTSESLPETMEAAVQRLRAILSEEDQTRIGMMRREELMQLHFGLGMWIRSNFGLWREGSPLMASLGQWDADDASGTILDALWRDLRQTGPSKRTPKPAPAAGKKKKVTR